MAGYSGTPLVKKLGLKAGMRAAFLGMPPGVRDALKPLPENLTLLKSAGAEMDFLHFFAEQTAELEKSLPQLKAALAKSGMLWVSWRKGKKGTDLTEDVVRKLALAGGLVDVKVCAVDETWSGLKLVYRLKDR